MLYSAAQKVREVVGWISEAEKWQAMIGTVTQEGLTQLAILLGLLLIAPLAGGAIDEATRPYRERWGKARAARRAIAEEAKDVLPHTTDSELLSLVSLAMGFKVSAADLQHGILVERKSAGERRFYSLAKGCERLVLREAQRRGVSLDPSRRKKFAELRLADAEESEAQRESVAAILGELHAYDAVLYLDLFRAFGDDPVRPYPIPPEKHQEVVGTLRKHGIILSTARAGESENQKPQLPERIELTPGARDVLPDFGIELNVHRLWLVAADEESDDDA